MRLLYISCFVLLCSVGCDDNADNQREHDDNLIQQYLTDNNLDATATDSGLYYLIDNQGSGENPNLSSTVTVGYKGYLLDGSVFDENNGATFPLNGVIEGWQEGIPFFKEGGTGHLFIPSHLAYGGSARPGIPANSVLVFDINLISVQ